MAQISEREIQSSQKTVGIAGHEDVCADIKV